MLGVGFIVIIPEGTTLVYGSMDKQQSAETMIGLTITGGFILMLVIDEIVVSIAHHSQKTKDLK